MMTKTFKTTKYALLAGVSAAMVIGAPLAANAAGFYIQEQSIAGQGAAFSGSTTNIHDPSAMYFNPAGITNAKGGQAHFGTHFLSPTAKLTNTGSTLGGGAISGGDGGNPYSLSPVPNIYVSQQLNEMFWIGVGVSAPFGLANEYNADWFGRYDSIKTDLRVYDVQPTLGVKLSDSLSFGVGLNIQKADAILTKAVTDGTEGVSRLDGNDISFGYNVGVQYQPWQSTVLAASYRSAQKHDLHGELSVAGTATSDVSTNASASLNLPDIATFGLSHAVTDRLTLQGQATWFGWNNFDNISVVVGNTVSSRTEQNYQTTWAFAVGAEYDLNEKWDLRTGVQFDETPTTDEYRTSLTPDGDRTWASVGATYKIRDNLDLDMAGTYIWIDDEQINVSRNSGQAIVRADTEGNVGILSLGLTYKF